jgi:hypothetical protein
VSDTHVRICTIEGCGKVVNGRGLCLQHYRRAKKEGNLESYPTQWPSPEERFWPKVLKTSGCWLWTGHQGWDGYGHIYVDGRKQYTHRVAYQWLVGPVPDGLVLDHLCRVRNCVNPDHLEPVTGRENTLRGFGVGAIAKRRTACAKGHEYTPENTRQDPRTGRRVCLTCQRASSRARSRRKKAQAEADARAAEIKRGSERAQVVTWQDGYEEETK